MIEIRKNPDGSIDEIVGKGKFHLEQMDSNLWALIFSDRKQALCVEISSARKIEVTESWTDP
jgi:hypothetical protein